MIPLLHTTILTFISILFHTGVDGGILSGFLHPLLGLDHLLAMIAVGMLSTQIGGRAVWYVPAAFVGAMAVGGIIGIIGIPLPFIEYGITASVLILGLAILADSKLPISAAMVFVAIFAIFHGYAHGTELPEAASTQNATYIAAYVNGFLIATAGLHLIGVFLGMIIEKLPRGTLTMRLSGALLAIIGIFLIAQV